MLAVPVAVAVIAGPVPAVVSALTVVSAAHLQAQA